MVKKAITIPEDVGILAYVAGLLDGDAWIGITKQKPHFNGHENPDKLRTRNFFYRLRVEVKQTDQRIVNFLMDNVGGYYHIERRATINGRKVYSWFIDGDHAARLLQAIYPYLIGKRDQADIAIKFRESFDAVYTNPFIPWKL